MSDDEMAAACEAARQRWAAEPWHRPATPERFARSDIESGVRGDIPVDYDLGDDGEGHAAPPAVA